MQDSFIKPTGQISIYIILSHEQGYKAKELK